MIPHQFPPMKTTKVQADNSIGFWKQNTASSSKTCSFRLKTKVQLVIVVTEDQLAATVITLQGCKILSQSIISYCTVLLVFEKATFSLPISKAFSLHRGFAASNNHGKKLCSAVGGSTLN